MDVESTTGASRKHLTAQQYNFVAHAMVGVEDAIDTAGRNGFTDAEERGWYVRFR
jgi:hypothetical protein